MPVGSQPCGEAFDGDLSRGRAPDVPRGITVNCVNPGPNDTGYADTATREFVAAHMPLARRWGQPADIAELVAFLVSDRAAWITGQTIDSDGGWSVRAGVPRE